MMLSRSILTTGLLALASRASAQVASICPTTNICFKLNIPSSTASSGNGDIFFQLSAPSSYEWVALGQGTGMAGSNIFVVYTSSGGNNVTLSPRSGTNHVQPNFNSAAQVTLLEGSGVSGGKMIANVKCSNCNQWSDSGTHTADFTASSGNWIYAAHTSGGPKNSNDQSISFTQHNVQDAFNWNYANAKGGNSVNPLVNAASSGTASGATATSSCVPRPSGSTAGSSGSVTSHTASRSSASTATTASQSGNSNHRGRPSTGSPTASPTASAENNEKRDSINYCDGDDSSNGPGFTSLGSSDEQSSTDKMRIAHGVLAALAFVIFFPAGAIAIRLASFPGVVWLHAAFQVFAYIVYIAAFALGIRIANNLDELDKYHPIIGIVVFVLLFFQPILGFLHHALFKKYESRTFWSYAHVWLGRLVITLGIINGGLGFMLADNTTNGIIVYSVVAGVIWLIWVAASVIGERRRSKSSAEQPSKYSDSTRSDLAQRNISRPINEHYAP